MLPSEIDWVFDTRNGAENIEMSRGLTKRNPTPLNSGTHDDVVEIKKLGTMMRKWDHYAHYPRPCYYLWTSLKW